MIYRKFYTLTISIFGNRQIFNNENISQRLYNYLKDKINGKSVRILVGTHGDFDKLALAVCKRLKLQGYDIHISLVYTSQKAIIRDSKLDDCAEYYKDVEKMMYDIENIYYKRQIVASNQKMVDDSDEVIVYFDEQYKAYSGTYLIIRYAKQTNKHVINLFDKNDKTF